MDLPEVHGTEAGGPPLAARRPQRVLSVRERAEAQAMSWEPRPNSDDSPDRANDGGDELIIPATPGRSLIVSVRDTGGPSKHDHDHDHAKAMATYISPTLVLCPWCDRMVPESPGCDECIRRGRTGSTGSKAAFTPTPGEIAMACRKIKADHFERKRNGDHGTAPRGARTRIAR